MIAWGTMQVTETAAVIPNPSLTMQPWAKLGAACILYALNGRSAWFASDYSRATDLEWTDEGTFIETDAVKLTHGSRYEFRFCAEPNKSMLRALMLSGDAHWDSVFIIPGTFEDRSKAIAILDDIDASIPKASGEVLTTFNDGEGILWIEHGQDIQKITIDFLSFK